MQLLQPLLAQVFAQRVLHVFLREKDVHALEAGVIRRHAIVLQARNGLHPLFRHVLLREHDGQLLGAVVAVVEEDHHVALLDGSVHRGVVDGLHELVRHTLVIGLLHGRHHVRGLLAFALHQEVVGLLHAVPALVAVHGIETPDDGRDDATGLLALGLQLLDKSFPALRVSVAAVHEAVHVGVLDAVLLGNLTKFEQVVQRRMHAARGSQPHQVHALAILLGIFVCRHDFGVLQDAPVGACAVDFHQILIHDAARANVQVAHLGVAHLPVGQAHVLARSQQLRVRVVLGQVIHVRRGGAEDGVVLSAIANAPTVENHQKCFLCHNNMYLK